MAFLILAILLALIILSATTHAVSFWIPLVIYVIYVMVRVYEKTGNYRDWKKKHLRDEKIALDEKAEEMASRGLALSSIRNQAEANIKQNFAFERNEAYRKFCRDLAETLLPFYRRPQ